MVVHHLLKECTLYQISYSVFPEMKLRGLNPNSYIHVSVSNLYIPKIGLPIWLQHNRQRYLGNLYIAHIYMNVETGRQNIIILFGK
jgi:hypothetical protein